MLLILILLILLFGGGGTYLGGPYFGAGIGLGGVLLIVLVIFLLRGVSW